MDITLVKEMLRCSDITGICSEAECSGICASDLMSEVLMMAERGHLIITNLLNMQTVRTAEMVEASGIIFVNGKEPNKEMVNLAKNKGISVLVTQYSLFETCGILYAYMQGDKT